MIDHKLIKDFFSTLDDEKRTLQMTAENVIQSKHVFCVGEPGEIRGLVGIRINYLCIPDLFIVVKKEYQGQGYGHKLMMMDCEFAAKHYSFLTLSTHLTPDYASAIHLYRKYGFKQFYQHGDHVWFILPFNTRGEIARRVLPFVMPYLPFLSAVFTVALAKAIIRKFRELARWR